MSLGKCHICGKPSVCMIEIDGEVLDICDKHNEFQEMEDNLKRFIRDYSEEELNGILKTVLVHEVMGA